MMWIVVKALILTVIVGVVGILSKSRMSAWWYAVIFILMLISQWAFHDKVHADDIYIDGINNQIEYENEMTDDTIRDIAEFTDLIKNPMFTILPSQTYYSEQIIFHKENAIRTFNEAKSRIWYLPNLMDRQNARYCFTSFMARILPGPPQSILVAIVITELKEYGLDCINEWDYIYDKLYWSKYHYEMLEFYDKFLETRSETGLGFTE